MYLILLCLLLAFCFLLKIISKITVHIQKYSLKGNNDQFDIFKVYKNICELLFNYSGESRAKIQ